MEKGKGQKGRTRGAGKFRNTGRKIQKKNRGHFFPRGKKKANIAERPKDPGVQRMWGNI